MRRGQVEVMLIAFDHDGNILNMVNKRSKLALDPKVYMATQAVGMQIHEEIDVPARRSVSAHGNLRSEFRALRHAWRLH